MIINALFAQGFEAGRAWRNNPGARSFDSLPYYRQNSADAQRFNRAFTAAQTVPAEVGPEQAYQALIAQRSDLAALYEGEAAH